MRVLKPLRLSCLYRNYRFLKKNYLGITAMVLYDFKEGESASLQSEQDLWQLFTDESVANFGAEFLDFGVPKRQAEIIVNGYGFGRYAQDNRTAVAIKCNNIRKELWVTGERIWINSKISEPKAFERIPISWANAYGGEGYTKNLSGKGKSEQNLEGLKAKFVPNIEDPKNPVRYEDRAYEPVSFSAIPVQYPGREKLMGTHDQKWQEEDFPGFAKDIDWTYFNQAPLGQRLVSLGIGDKVEFTNLHPEKSHLELTIPPLQVKSFLKDKDSNDLRQVDLGLTTVWAYPHLEQAILIFHGVAPVREDDGDDLEYILFAVEHQDRPKSLDYYKQVISWRLEPQVAGLHSMIDKELIDQEFISGDIAASIKSNKLLQNMLNRQASEMERLDTLLIERGLKDYPVEDAEELKALKALVEPHQAKGVKQGEYSVEQIVEAQLASISEQKLSFLQVAREQRKAQRQLKEKMNSAGLSLDNLGESSFNDLERQSQQQKAFFQEQSEKKYQEDKEKQLGKGEHEFFTPFLRSSFQKKSDYMNAAIEQSLKKNKSERQLINQEKKIKVSFSEALKLTYRRSTFVVDEGVERDGCYDGLYLKKCHISNLVFENCDFSNIVMEDVGFENVVFINCTFKQTKLTNTTFINCTFEESIFTRMDGERISFISTQFMQSSFKGWLQNRVSLDKCQFRESQFEDNTFFRTISYGLSFVECEFKRCAFVFGRYKDIVFDSCFADSLAIIKVARIEAILISNAQWEKVCIAPDMKIGTVNIVNSSIKYSSFRKITVQSLQVKDSELLQNDFSTSLLSSAQIENTSFKSSLFIRTDFQGAHFNRVDCSFTMFKGADFSDALLKRVSFFCADMPLIKTNNKTIQHDCLVKRVNFLPRRQGEEDYVS